MMRSRQKAAMFINVMIVLPEFFAFVARTIYAGRRKKNPYLYDIIGFVVKE